MIVTRRNFFGLLAAPAVIRVAELMPVSAVIWGEVPRFSVALPLDQIKEIAKALKALGKAKVMHRGEAVYLTYIEPNTSSDDPLAQPGYVGWKSTIEGKQFGSYTVFSPQSRPTLRCLTREVAEMAPMIEGMRQFI